MAKEFFECIAGKGGIAGEYEPLTESEFATAPGPAYTPPERGVFKVVAARTIQLLQDSPIYVETFQTSAATLRMPSGLVATNDAADGRMYFVRNSDTATGVLTIEDHVGTTTIGELNPGDLVIVLHGEDNNWDASEPVSGTDGFGNAFRYHHHQGVPGAGTRYLRTGQSIPCSGAGDRLIDDVRIIGMSIRTDMADLSRDYDVEFITSPSGTPVVVATLALPSGSNSEGRNDLSDFVAAPTEIGVRLVRTSGGGASSFNFINVNVQFG